MPKKVAIWTIWAALTKSLGSEQNFSNEGSKSRQPIALGGSDSRAGASVRWATPADLPSIGRLSALLVEEHYDFDLESGSVTGRCR